MFMTCGARAPSNQPPGWGAARHHRGTIFRASLLLVWFAGDIKSECPSNDDEQHCRCVVWEEKTVLQSLDVAFAAPSQKSSFLRVLHSCEGGHRLALLQRDSRAGRARIRKILALAEWELSSHQICALLNAQQIKNGESWGMRLCHLFEDRLSVHACVPSQLGGKCCALLTKPLLHAMALHLFNFFCSLFVNLLCRKPEIESLGFTCNWLVLVGRLACTRATCMYFRVADKFTTAKRKLERSTKSFGIPSFRLVVA